jgi:DNA-binding MarR family transcriptional regulator
MFDILKFKMEFVESKLSPWQIDDLERRFRPAMNRKGFLASGFDHRFAGAFVATIYPLLKLNDWLGVPVFEALVTECLQRDHGIPRVEASKLVSDLSTQITSFLHIEPRTICHDDREFLTYAYVRCALAADDGKLELDLGLGTVIGGILRNGIQALERGQDNLFIPEYEALLAAITLELSHELKSHPDALEVHALKYQLLNALGDGAQDVILEENLRELLVWLVELGMTGNGGAVRRGKSWEVVSTKQLAVAGLIEKRKSTAHGRDDTLRLSAIGAGLTARSAAQNSELQSFLKTKLGHFIELPVGWQCSIIDLQFKFLLDKNDWFCDNFHRLDPAVAERMLKQFIVQRRDVGIMIVDRLKGQKLLPWHRTAIVKALMDVPVDKYLIGVIEELVKDQTSRSLQGAVECWLMQHSMEPVPHGGIGF